MNDDLTLEFAEKSESLCPVDFLRDYTIMECLSEGHGTATFLVQDGSGCRFAAKCYDKNVWEVGGAGVILKTLSHPGLPRYVTSYENRNMTVTVREYVEGEPLDRYASDRELTDAERIRIAVSLCDILTYLHGQPSPVIHRDLKPQNVIMRPGGEVCLIDFDIARVWSAGNDADTQAFGTREYAPPEQYGFSQTDCRADIYSLGVLLRFLFTGDCRENAGARIYAPVKKIISRCTAFAPQARFSSAEKVKRALLLANPASQRRRRAVISVCAVLAAALVVFGGVKLYQALTYSPFSDDAIPAYLSDEERTADAVAYLSDKFGTDLFDASGDIANIGFLRQVLVEVYGLEEAYACGVNTGMPMESEDFFLPWGWDDGQNIARDVMVYAAVKLYDPELVADWSSLTDDNGYYPGVRVAVAFADENGITTGANRPGDITVGDMAIILANADRVFSSAEG